MTDNLNLFANWIFTAITSVWNFWANSPLLKWFLAFLILKWIIEHFRKYFGK